MNGQCTRTGLFGAALALVLGASTGPLGAAEARITGAVDSKPAYTLTDQEQRYVSHAGARILKHVDRARAALENEKHAEARKQIQKARKLVTIIENALPTHKVTARLQSGDIVYTDEETVKPMVVTIYEEIEKVNILDAVEEAKREAARQDAAASVVNVDLVHTRAELDVGLADLSLSKAATALAEDRYEAADTALRAVQSGVTLEFAEVDVPLEEARENLFLARDLVERGKTDEAKFAMKVASDALQRYQAAAGDQRVEEVQEMREAIDKLAERLDETPAEDVTAQLLEWWDQVTEWFS